MLDLPNNLQTEDALNEFLQQSPFMRHLGIRVDVKETDAICVLPFKPNLLGNIWVGSMHGGAIASHLEAALVIQTVFEMKPAQLPRIIDFTVNYFRSGRGVDTYARAQVVKKGRRIVNVQAVAWQDNPEKPIAAVHGQLLLKAG